MKSWKKRHRTFVCEQLELRCLLAGFQSIDASDFQAVIVAGDPNQTPTDSPAQRVDANTPDSPFRGVGSLQITANRGTFICTGTPIDAIHVVTAAHCVDLNGDGVSDKKDGIRSVTFNLNLDTDSGTDAVDARINATSWRTHPDFTGFDRPSVNDDVAVVTLGSSVPTNVPTYSFASTDMVAQQTHLYMVGYGRSGDGLSGYTTNASFTVKRVGENMVDAFYGQDDAGRALANEVFRFDFDGPSGNGSFGGPTLGNDRETTLGGGDSGGPSFILLPGGDPSSPSSYLFAGVNTFTQGSTAPKFGTLGGGINVFPYKDWILNGTAPNGGTSGGKHNSTAGPSLEIDHSSDGRLALVLSLIDISLISIDPDGSVPTPSLSRSAPSHGNEVSTFASLPAQLAQVSSRDVSKTEVPATKSATDELENPLSYVDWLNAVDEVFNLETL